MMFSIKSGATESLFVNGTQVWNQSGKRGSIAATDRRGNWGRGYNDDTYFAGDIAEVLVYTKALDTVERQLLEAYLIEKYFLSSTPVNRAPTVDAGPDQTVYLPAEVTLKASANDDGLPYGTLLTSWRKASGPGSVSFANVNATRTRVSFSSAGTYVLRLDASDGQLTVNDEVTIIATTSRGIPVGAIVLKPGDDVQAAVS